jgi:acetolactate synthase-1/3 small subunit
MVTEGTGRPASSRLQALVVYVEDKPGVLTRVASLFRRRSFNIASLTVGHTDKPGVSRMTIVMEGDDADALRCEANLYRLVNVLRVENVTHLASVIRDLALVKVCCPATARRDVLQACEVFRARVIDMSQDALIVEITGTEDKIEGLLDVLRPFGIIEMVRTGSVAMTRGADAPSVDPHFVHATVAEVGEEELEGGQGGTDVL